MRKLFIFLALGAFMTAAVSANACDDTKAMTGKGSKMSCCTAKGAKASKECTAKEMKACAAKGMKTSATKDCCKEMKASNAATKACCAKKETKKS